MSFKKYGGLNYNAKNNIVKNHYGTSDNFQSTETIGQPNSKMISLSHIDMSQNSIINIGGLYFYGNSTPQTQPYIASEISGNYAPINNPADGINNYAPINNPTFTGIPLLTNTPNSTSPTAITDVSYVNTYVTNAIKDISGNYAPINNPSGGINNYAPINNPTFTGIPSLTITPNSTSPTAITDVSYVTAAISNASNGYAKLATSNTFTSDCCNNFYGYTFINNNIEGLRFQDTSNNTVCRFLYINTSPYNFLIDYYAGYKLTIRSNANTGNNSAKEVMVLDSSNIITLGPPYDPSYQSLGYAPINLKNNGGSISSYGLFLYDDQTTNNYNQDITLRSSNGTGSLYYKKAFTINNGINISNNNYAIAGGGNILLYGDASDNNSSVHLVTYSNTFNSSGILNEGAGLLIQTLSSAATFSICDVKARSFQVTSDYRIKENVENINISKYNIDNLRPVTYKNKLTNKKEFGLIAHEVQEVFPDLVSGIKDDETNQSVNYTSLISLLIKEIQELKNEIKILKHMNI